RPMHRLRLLRRGGQRRASLRGRRRSGPTHELDEATAADHCASSRHEFLPEKRTTFGAIARTLRPEGGRGNGDFRRENSGGRADNETDTRGRPTMPQWMIAFIVLDVVIMAFVIALFVSGRLKINVKINGTVTGVNFHDLMEFSKERQARIAEDVRANWSGAPEQLPQVLESLLGEMEHDAQARGLTVSRDMLKSILASSLRQQHLAKGNELEQAMKRVT